MIPYPSAGPPQEIDLGPVHPQDCEACGCEQPFHLRLSYRYERLFWVFGNLRGMSYVLVCDVCGTPYRIPPDVAYKLGQLERDPIPFMHRYGCVVLLAVVIVLGIIGLLFDVPNPKR